MKKVVGVGACVFDTLINCDRFPTEDTKQKAESVFVSGGGPVGNALVVMAKLGVKTEVIGGFGSDSAGEYLLNDFKKKQVTAKKSNRLETMLESKLKEHDKISYLKMELYPDWKSGMISKEEYLALKEKFDHQLEQLETSIAHIQEEIKKYKESTSDENQFITHFLKYKNIDTLSREVIVELIEMIYVHEGGSITVEFKYQDEYQRLLDLLEEHKNNQKAG